jgi:hypothetical protein
LESTEAGGSGKYGINDIINRSTYPVDILIGPGMETPKNGDIVIEYHPQSKRGTRIFSPEEYKESLGNYHLNPTGPLDGEPWRPFSSREDFKFAEFVHDAKLNRKQIECLIELLQRCQEEPGSFTLKSYSDLKGASDRASKLLTPVLTFSFLP